MRLATIFFILFLLCAAFISSSQKAEESAPQIIEVAMIDDNGNKVGTALFPLSLRDNYSSIEFYDGIAPPAGTDFDIVEVPMQEGGGVYLLCVK